MHGQAALVSLADVRDQGGGDLSDATLTRLIGLASELVTDYLGRTGELLYEEDIVEIPDLGAYPSSRMVRAINHDLYLRRWPIYDVATVAIRGASQEPKIVEPSDLPIHSAPDRVFRTPEWDRRGSLFRFGGWPTGEVVVTYSGGYRAPGQHNAPECVPEVPKAIQEATILTVLRLAGIVSREGELDLVEETTVAGWEQKWGSGSSSRSPLIPEAARLHLSSHKRKRWRVL